MKKIDENIVATVKEVMDVLKGQTERSAWGKAVIIYARELIEDFKEDTPVTRELLLNGARDWNQYSWGGCSLAYNYDIAERLCSPSAFKKCNEGAWKPNRNEEWLDVQARALSQACGRVMRAVSVIRRRKMKEEKQEVEA